MDTRKILTIAIPTFNRASFLKNQLDFLSEEIIGFEDDCEIFVSDNCSDDETSVILEEFQQKLKSVTFQVWRNQQNVGAIKNIIHCINSARSNHVWVCSDDDKLHKGVIANIISNLKAAPETGLLFLNYSIHSVRTGDSFPKWSDQEEDIDYIDSKSKFEEIVEAPWGWEALTVLTATVFRTDLAQQSILKWQYSSDCILVQLYIIGFCTFYGSLRTTKDYYFEYIEGRSFYANTKVYLKMRYLDTSKVFLKLMEMGYNPQLCKRRGLEMFTSIQDWLNIAKSLLKRPYFTIKIGIHCIVTVAQLLLSDPNSSRFAGKGQGHFVLDFGKDFR